MPVAIDRKSINIVESPIDYCLEVKHCLEVNWMSIDEYLYEVNESWDKVNEYCHVVNEYWKQWTLILVNENK